MPGNPLDRNKRSRTFEEQLAMKGLTMYKSIIGALCLLTESEAEKNLIPAKEAPPFGFLSIQRLRNRTLQQLGMYRQNTKNALPTDTVVAKTEKEGKEEKGLPATTIEKKKL